MTRPWYKRPPPGYPLPLYPQAEGSGGGGGAPSRSHHGRGCHTHVEGSSGEFVVWAAMPPRTWIKFPQFFAEEMPPRGPLELWLQHAECSTPATGAEVEVISPGKIFMTCGWGEVARACRAEGPLTIHFEYDNVSSTRRAAAWSAALEGAARMVQLQAPSLPSALPTAPPAAAMVPGSPATLPSLASLRSLKVRYID